MSTLAIQRTTMTPLLMLQSMLFAITEYAEAPRSERRFHAAWVPFSIVMAGAAAMTVWCTLQGYSGWDFQFSWRGVRAKCV